MHEYDKQTRHDMITPEFIKCDMYVLPIYLAIKSIPIIVSHCHDALEVRVNG